MPVRHGQVGGRRLRFDAMDVEIRHLRAFVAVVDAGSVTRAGRALGIGQPALSRTIAQLEHRLGVPLLERGARGMTPTPVGRRVLHEARAAVHQFDEAIAAATSGAAAVLGFSWLLPAHIAPDLQRHLAAQRSGMALRLRRVERPLEELRAGRVNACIHRLPVVDDDLEALPIGQEPRVLAIAPGSRFAAAVGCAWADLRAFPIVVNRSSGTIRPTLWNPPPKEAVACANFDEWLAYVAADRGIGVVPGLAADLAPHSGVEYHPIPDAPPVVLQLVYRRGDTRPATATLAAWAATAGEATPEQETAGSRARAT